MRSMWQPGHRGSFAPLSARHENIFPSKLLGKEPIVLGSRSGASAPEGIWRSTCLVGLPALLPLVLVLGLLRRNLEVPRNCVSHGIPPRLLRTHGHRLRNGLCPNLRQGCSLQSRGFSRPTLELGPHIHVPPLRKGATYSFVNPLPLSRDGPFVRLCNTEQTDDSRERTNNSLGQCELRKWRRRSRFSSSGRRSSFRNA
jgi:hypothetical protein